MRFRWILVLATCFAAIIMNTASAEDQPLLLGDPAPKLEVREFVKGEAVKQFASGKVYVVEFWATWCGPCLETIPHLTELQKKNPEVIFLGVSLDEQTSDVTAFVKEMGDKMDYRVAIDTRTKDVKDGLMHKSWLAASLQEGIPVAFIVNKEGKVAWIGHPGELEDPLSQIVTGKWDLAAEVKKYTEAIAVKKQAAALEAEFATTVEAKKYKQALELVEKAITANPSLETEWAVAKFWTLILLKQNEEAATYGNHIVDELFSDLPEQLIMIAGLVVRPDEHAPFGGELVNGKTDGTNAKSKSTEAIKADAKDKPNKDAQRDQTEVNPTLDAKLVKLAIRAAERATEQTLDADITVRTTFVEILAAAYTAGGEKEKATTVLTGELEALQEHSAVVKAAILLVKSQLKDLNSQAGEQKTKTEDDKSEKSQVDKKTESDKKTSDKKSDKKAEE
ncbi:MAG: resA 8 [Planctomycetaceae bacterium]|nr:resA 8 [Planctomycetaceae bacterium]